MATRLEDIMAAFPPLGHATATKWMARCPVHEDTKGSLSVKLDGERVLLYCFAGCETKAICDAVGLHVRDLFLTEMMPVTMTRKQRGYPTAQAAVSALSQQHGKPTKWWAYRDLSGTPIAVVVRWDKNGAKTIRPVSRHNGRWHMKGMNTPHLLYRLPEVSQASRVFVCEGEKAADAVVIQGMEATTSPHGANSASKADWSPLQGREVMLLPDNDEPGLKYAEEVRSILDRLGVTAGILLLPDMPPHGDAADMAKDDMRWDTLRAWANHD